MNELFEFDFDSSIPEFDIVVQHVSTEGGGGQTIEVDSELSTTSNNPVKNKAITQALNGKVSASDLATVATTGSYNDLTNKPTIPSSFPVDVELDDESTNPVQNAVVTTALNGKLTTPYGGTSGQVLQKTTEGSRWADIGTPSAEQIQTAVNAYIAAHPEVLTPISQATKSAMLDIAAHVAYIDANGQSYYNALDAALNAVAVLSITAVYTQSGTVYDTDSLDSLKADLVVTANYDDGTSADVTSACTLSGTLTEGTSTITATYQDKTATFSVTVSTRPSKSDMNGWADGIAYTDLEIVANSYVSATDGTFIAYNGWSRTGYVPCNGASTITIPPMGGSGTNPNYNAFYTSDHQFISTFRTQHTGDAVITVPSNAYYFIISESTAHVNTMINAGIIPNA